MDNRICILESQDGTIFELPFHLWTLINSNILDREGMSIIYLLIYLFIDNRPYIKLMHFTREIVAKTIEYLTYYDINPMSEIPIVR